MIYMSFWPFELVRNGQYWLVVWGWRGGVKINEERGKRSSLLVINLSGCAGVPAC